MSAIGGPAPGAGSVRRAMAGGGRGGGGGSGAGAEAGAGRRAARDKAVVPERARGIGACR
jgi:hypothetical protein